MKITLSSFFIHVGTGAWFVSNLMNRSAYSKTKFDFMNKNEDLALLVLCLIYFDISGNILRVSL